MQNLPAQENQLVYSFITASAEPPLPSFSKMIQQKLLSKWASSYNWAEAQQNH